MAVGNESHLKVYNSSHNDTKNLILYYRGAEPIIWICVIYLVAFIGSLFFVLLLKIFYMQREVRNGSKSLLLHLILLEFSLCAVQLPMQHTFTFLAIRGFPASVYCAEEMFLAILIIHTANWSSLFLAIMRYIASTNLQLYQSLNFWWHRLVMIALSWIVSLGVTLPIYFGIGGQWTVVPPFGDCGTLSNEVGGYFRWHQTLGSYFPNTATVVIYLIIFLQIQIKSRAMQSSVAPNSQSPLGQGGRTIQRRLVVTRMLFATSVWNCVCYLPSPISVNLFPALFRHGISLRLWTKAVQLCGYALSPLIFLLLNSDYQAGLRSILRHTSWHRRADESLKSRQNVALATSNQYR